MKFRDLRANEIDVRVGQVGEGYCTLLLYKDARVDMDILDETVGAMNWQREHYEVKGNLFCRVGIFGASDIEPCRWVFKADCGTESNTEKEKGESSDSFKRACVNWGIGRELYTSPLIKVNCKTKDKKVQDLTSFSVADIVIENKAITGLQIKAYDKENKTTDIVFSWGKLKDKTKGENTAKTGLASQENKKVEQVAKKEENKPMTLEEALEMGFISKGKEVYVKDMTDEHLLLMKDYTKMPRLAEACAIVLSERAKQKVENEQGQNS